MEPSASLRPPHDAVLVPSGVAKGPDDLPDLLRCDDGEHPLAKRVALLAGAALCFVLGVVGWLIPIVTGIPFYVLGLVLLAKGWPWAGHRVNAWERRLPRRWRLLLRPRWRREHAAELRGEGSASGGGG